MTNEFDDITKRLGRPKWFDRLGYPRYCKFHPDRVHDIYASYVAFIEVGCQNCNKKWRVAVAWHNFNSRELVVDNKLIQSFTHKVELPTKTSVGSFHYGDPPSHVQHDHAGSTMNSIPLQVLEFWKKKRTKKFWGWVRVKKYEITIKVDWMNN